MALALSFFLLESTAYAAYTIKDGKLANVDSIATLPPDQHFAKGMSAIEDGNWKEAASQFKILTSSFPNTSYGQDGFYFLGVAFFNLEEFDLANDSFSQYLKCQNNPKFFLSAIEFKYAIADKLKNGAKRRFFGTKQLPKWATGRTLALKIYDEVISAMPSNEIAAKALYSKGCLLWELKEFRDSVEAFQLVTKRFPKHELAPECYLLITKVYLDQSRYEFQNPDLLALAEISLRRFKHDFPREERIETAEKDVMEIKEIYARGLFETGMFYERINHPKASKIYYYNAIKQFPDTSIARICKQRLLYLDPSFVIQENPKEDLSEELQHS